MQENTALKAIIYLMNSITKGLINEFVTYLPYLIGAVIIALVFIIGNIAVKRIFKK